MPINKNAYQRYRLIDQRIRNSLKPPPSIDDLVNYCREQLDLDVSPSSIEKDITTMRMGKPYGFDAPIVYDRLKKGYVYSEKSFTLEGNNLEIEELTAIEDALSFLKQTAFTAFGNQFASAFDKVLTSYSVMHQSLKDPVVLLDSRTTFKGMEHLELLIHACKIKSPVSLMVYEPQQRKVITDIIHPFLIKEFNNQWFVIAISEKNEKAKVFPLHTIHAPVLIKKLFIPLSEELISAYRDKMYGVHALFGLKVEDLMFDCSRFVALELESYPLHTSQKLRKVNSGMATVRLTVIPTLELVQYIRSHGKEIKWIGPDKLEKLIVQ